MRFGAELRELCPLCQQPVPDPDAVLQIGDLEIRPVEGIVRINHRVLALTPTERRLLVLVAANPGVLVTWADLYCAATGEDVDPTRVKHQKQAVRVHLSRLRTKLGPEIAGYLEHVRGPMSEGGLRLTLPA